MSGKNIGHRPKASAVHKRQSATRDKIVDASQATNNSAYHDTLTKGTGGPVRPVGATASIESTLVSDLFHGKSKDEMESARAERQAEAEEERRRREAERTEKEQRVKELRQQEARALESGVERWELGLDGSEASEDVPDEWDA
eukprot:TRINITY_DN7871_c1_g1_i1.p1 TRINITY_DN7871_c1_g1~~TRINITY_DN7871_c1_g1_i1.p1  ORF type:complete len:143 (+),score=36.96 TRINITY_DN7871_c1_g1_i1:207-635(+)